MNNQKITQIESKIKELKNLLNTWEKTIATYHSQLQELTDQLTTIKKQINMNQKAKIVPATLNNNKK